MHSVLLYGKINLACYKQTNLYDSCLQRLKVKLQERDRLDERKIIKVSQSERRVWLQTCTLSTCMLRHLHARTLVLPRVISLEVFIIFYFVLFIDFFCLNLSTFYNSSQVVKTRKKLKYNVTCNRCLHFLLPVTSLAFDTNRVRCQRRQDTVVVKRLKLI